MKKLFAFFILIMFGLNILWLPSFAATDGDLPEIPVLPSLEIYSDKDADVFSPSITPSPVVTTPIQQLSVPTVTQTKNQSAPVASDSYKDLEKKVKKGKSFKVSLVQKVSSDTPICTRLTFTSLSPVTNRYVTIPKGTVFTGTVIDSHGPQYTGNGGLIVIGVNKMNYNGRTYDIDAKVTVANGKLIFFNNIKGERMYFKSFPTAMKPGTKFFKKMMKATKNLAKNENGVEIVLTPVTFLAGSVVYVVNLAASPVLAIFYKGKSITIPAGSQFTIKLREDVSL